MNKSSLHFLAFGAVLLLLAASHAPAQAAKPASTPAAAGRLTYESFRLIHTRNVFDPDRRPVRPSRDPGPPPVSPRSDYVALTGTMINNDKSFAFFSGSRSDFNKVLTVRDKIANATVTQITPLNIEIEREGKRTLVTVGQTVPLDAQSVPGAPPAPDLPPPPAAPEASPAGPLAGPAVAASTGVRAPGAAAAPPPTAPGVPPSTSKLEEIRQRMMKSRQQELK